MELAPVPVRSPGSLGAGGPELGLRALAHALRLDNLRPKRALRPCHS